MNRITKTTPIRQLTVFYLLVMLAFPLSAQEKADSVTTFRFLAGKDMFFAPGMNNGSELARLFDFVERHRDQITSHEMPLYVDGYCSSRRTTADNLRIARIRSNRVKSELITRKGLTEDCFITHNHAEQGDFVEVRILPANKKVLPSEETPVVETKEPDPVVEVVEEPVIETVIVAETVVIPEPEDTTAQQPPVAEAFPPNVRQDSPFLLKTNLLYYVALMPSLEIEWKFAPRWSVALEAQGAWYDKKSPRRVYRVATLMPELRYWTIRHSQWHGMYVGLFAGAGLYDLDLSNSKKGHEGEAYMGGISTGYMWPIGKHLSLDAGIGVGYLRARDKEYLPLDGHFLYQLTKHINYFGPLRLKLSLVWRIPK